MAPAQEHLGSQTNQNPTTYGTTVHSAWPQRIHLRNPCNVSSTDILQCTPLFRANLD